MIALTYSLAQSLSDRRVRVNCVAPGPVWTPLIPATMYADRVDLSATTHRSDGPLSPTRLRRPMCSSPLINCPRTTAARYSPQSGARRYPDDKPAMRRLASRRPGKPSTAWGAASSSCSPRIWAAPKLKKWAFRPIHASSGKVSMTEKNSGPEEGIKGVVEDVKGKAKEAVGTVTGRDDMVREGKAQQDKADAQRDAAKKEAEAEPPEAAPS